MKEFGNKNTFAIQCHPYLEQYKDDPDAVTRPEDYEEWASVYFWVNGKNIFEFKDYGPNATYSYDISILVEFFCRNLIYHITDDPFPVNTTSKIGAEMINETLLVEEPDDDIKKWAKVDWENVDIEIYDKIDMWNYHHGMLNNSGGSFLPDLYICKTKNKIEISWQNDFPHENENGEFYFKYQKGVEYVDIKIYRDTVAGFCLDYLNQFKDKYPEALNKQRIELQKAIDIIL
jgi:hypothetical protein